MKLVISDSIQKKYPELRIGVVVAEDVNNNTSTELEEFVTTEFRKFASKHEHPSAIAKHKNILAWREIYRSFGVNPKKKKPTAEALLTRVVRSSFVPNINPAVNAYLASEMCHYLPIGGYDLDQIDGDIELRESTGGEEFVGVGSSDVELTMEGEVVYGDDARILTRRWNYRDCDYSKIDVRTKCLALFVEGPISEISDNELKDTANNMSANLSTYCNAKTTVLFLDKGQHDLTLLPCYSFSDK